MSEDPAILQNALDGAGFAGLAIGACLGLALGVWLVGRCWRWAMRDVSRWRDAQLGRAGVFDARHEDEGSGGDGAGS